MGADARAAAIGRILLRRRLTLAVAESCTGGMLGQRITAVAGSSRYFRGGVIAYANPVKHGLLGVKTATLRADGAVSASVAVQMAQGVAKTLRADVGIGITGVAGPGGGSREKPVGLVYVAVCLGRHQAVHECRFSGGRAAIRSAACRVALELLRGCVETWTENVSAPQRSRKHG